MGPSVSFLLPLTIAQKLPVRNSWKLIIKRLPIPLPIFYYLEFIREVFHPAAKGVRQKESGKKVTKKVTKASEKVTEK